mmetsp:Transcript_80224/g.141947  ORF Transcript_80224/g.141947 Transcript_80224/m.141947 type:complete len:111 (+) Transcript_80224:530-862(+)
MGEAWLGQSLHIAGRPSICTMVLGFLLTEVADPFFWCHGADRHLGACAHSGGETFAFRLDGERRRAGCEPEPDEPEGAMASPSAGITLCNKLSCSWTTFKASHGSIWCDH